jgi:hypothetical protein
LLRVHLDVGRFLRHRKANSMLELVCPSAVSFRHSVIGCTATILALVAKQQRF